MEDDLKDLVKLKNLEETIKKKKLIEKIHSRSFIL